MLINCALYRDGRKVADIPTDQIHEYIGQPNCFVWVALRDPDSKELEDMQAEFNLHPLAVEDARHGHQRPKIEEYGDSLFAVRARRVRGTKLCPHRPEPRQAKFPRSSGPL
jgi:magnesium transporter